MTTKLPTFSRKTISALAASVGLAALSSPALAQDPGADPTFGDVSLSAGFDPDPYTVEVISGGGISADVLGGSCTGYIADAPDFDLYYDNGSGILPLDIYVDSTADTTLVINMPDGSWLCDDDSGDGVNPYVSLENPQTGLYDIWVGSYDSEDQEDATIYITELGGSLASSGTLDPGAEPTYGDVTLEAGFTPDPYEVSLISGGDISASDAVGDFCSGYAASAPDFDLYYTAGSLPLNIFAESDSDTTLIVNLPDGSWACDDDGGEGVDPLLVFENPQSGLYDIWVGSYGEDNGDSATLYISELDTAGSTATPNPGADPLYGSVSLDSGFIPDPHTVELSSGGPIPASRVDASCSGYVAEAPDFDLYYESGSFPLHIWVESDSDTTLLINTPDGNWICDDDSGAGTDPYIAFRKNPPAGLYDIWVGSYGEDNGDSATLYISEVNAPED